jgi:sugar O-acyltransferase (sialic acid O-acetyltransferase NeuD family)
MNNMNDLAIYGAGGFGREIACMIRKINQRQPTWNFIGFFDDGLEVGYGNEYGQILGGLDDLNSWEKPLSIAFAIGSSEILSRLTGRITNPLLDFPNIVSPDTIFLDEENVSLGKGNIFCAGCLVSCNVTVGDFNIFISMTSIGHDATIGNCNVFMPSTRIAGRVVIGDENVFGVSSTILQQVRIGSHTTIGASSLVVRKTKDGKTYMGSPATILRYCLFFLVALNEHLTKLLFYELF